MAELGDLLRFSVERRHFVLHAQHDINQRRLRINAIFDAQLDAEACELTHLGLEAG